MHRRGSAGVSEGVSVIHLTDMRTGKGCLLPAQPFLPDGRAKMSDFCKPGGRNSGGVFLQLSIDSLEFKTGELPSDIINKLDLTDVRSDIDQEEMLPESVEVRDIRSWIETNTNAISDENKSRVIYCLQDVLVLLSWKTQL